MPVVVVAAAAVIVVVVVFEDGDASDFDFNAFDDRSVEFDAFGMIHFVGTKFGHEETKNNHAHDYLEIEEM